MTTDLPILRFSAGDGVLVDLEKLLVSRMLVQGTSGAGKSWLLRYLLEQTRDRVQQIVIDREGEFVTLRDRHPYLLVGPGGDLPADVRGAKLLAKKLLELKVSTLIDLSELNLPEQRRFVAQFVDTMAHARRELWTDCLVVIDEAQLFAPEKGQSEAATALANLASLGRKRGYCLVLATSRLAKLSKDASAECLNKLIGRTSSDDLTRAIEELGKSVTDRTTLRSLDPGTFFAYGPAISVDPVLVRSGLIETKPPARGKARPPVPPAPAAIRAILGDLADLPQQAEHEAQDLATLRLKVAELQRALAAKPAAAPPPPPEVRTVEKLAIRAEHVDRLEKAAAQLENQLGKLRVVVEDVNEGVRQAASTQLHHSGAAPMDPPVLPPIAKTPAEVRRQLARVAPRQPAPKPSTSDMLAANRSRQELTGPERRVLDALAWFEGIGITDVDSTALAFIAGYKPGGAYNNTKGSLRSKGLVDYPAGGRVAFTERGRSMAQFDGEPVSIAILHAKVLERLSGPEQRVLRVVLDCWPGEVSSDDLASASGYSAGGAFNNVRGRLRALGLIDYPRPGFVIAQPLLFPEGMT